VKIGAPVTDITAGILGCGGPCWPHCIPARSTGQGQMVDTSLFEAGIIHTYWQSAILLCRQAERTGRWGRPTR